MKQIDNRQNKLNSLKTHAQPPSKSNPAAISAERLAQGLPHAGGIVYGLIKDLQVATRIAQAAKHCHIAVHNFDKAEPLLTHAKQHRPLLVMLDWDGCESEAFKVLKEMNENADLKSVPNVGYLSSSKSMVRDEARRAGCHRVYTKTEFMHDLELLIARYTQ
jgi:hypothetical protein